MKQNRRHKLFDGSDMGWVLRSRKGYKNLLYHGYLVERWHGSDHSNTGKCFRLERWSYIVDSDVEGEEFVHRTIVLLPFTMALTQHLHQRDLSVPDGLGCATYVCCSF